MWLLVVFFSLTQDKLLWILKLEWLVKIYTPRPKWNSWLRPWSQIPHRVVGHGCAYEQAHFNACIAHWSIWRWCRRLCRWPFRWQTRRLRVVQVGGRTLSLLGLERSTCLVPTLQHNNNLILGLCRQLWRRTVFARWYQCRPHLNIHYVSKKTTLTLHTNFYAHQPILVIFLKRYCWVSMLSNGDLLYHLS